MVRKIWVKNYRGMADVEVELEPISVFVGHNSSGKSNLVDVFRFFRDLCRYGLDAAVAKRGGMGAIRRWSPKGKRGDVEISLEIGTEEFEGVYSLTLGSERKDEYRVKGEICDVKAGDNGAGVHFETRNGQWIDHPETIQPTLSDRSPVLPLISDHPPFSKIYREISGFSFYNILPGVVSAPQKPTNPYPLDEHGENFASTLRELQRSADLMGPLKSAVAHILPNVIDLQVSRVGGYLITQILQRMDHQHHARFDLTQESDGTLRILGLLVALYQGSPTSLVALEEPELTVHPGLLPMLWEEIENAGERGQILVTTHSPDLLDLCEGESIRVVQKADGLTTVGPIESSQRETIRERLFAPGELLRAHGLRQDPHSAQIQL